MTSQSNDDAATDVKKSKFSTLKIFFASQTGTAKVRDSQNHYLIKVVILGIFHIVILAVIDDGH